MLENNKVIDKLEVTLEDVENSNRKVLIIKARAAYHTFRNMILLHCAEEILFAIIQIPTTQRNKWIKSQTTSAKYKQWTNIGGQLILKQKADQLINNIISGKVKSWEEIHQFYQEEKKYYIQDKLTHAIAAYKAIFADDLSKKESLKSLMAKALTIKTDLLNHIISSREKDYSSPYRSMVYDNRAEMDAVTGKLEENSFIIEQTAALKKMKAQIRKLMV